MDTAAFRANLSCLSSGPDAIIHAGFLARVCTEVSSSAELMCTAAGTQGHRRSLVGALKCETPYICWCTHCWAILHPACPRRCSVPVVLLSVVASALERCRQPSTTLVVNQAEEAREGKGGRYRRSHVHLGNSDHQP